MKKKYKLLFKYDIDQYKAGSVHELELERHEVDSLTRRGCIFAKEDAELTKEQVKDEPKEEIKAKEKPEKELNDVANKKSRKRAKVQAEPTSEE